MYNVEFCDPFDGIRDSYWMKLEHLGRYLWACSVLQQQGKTHKAADMACADGYGTRILSQYVEYVVGADRSMEYLSKCRDTQSLKFLCMDLNQDFPTEEMLWNLDAVVCFETLEHVKNPQTLLKKFAECLNPAGLLLLSIPNIKYERFDENGNNLDPFHLHVFTEDTVREYLKEAGFRIIQVLGQDIPNRVVSRIHDLKQIQPDSPLIANSEHLFSYDKQDLITAASLLAWPEVNREQESYSVIYLCEVQKGISCDVCP